MKCIRTLFINISIIIVILKGNNCLLGMFRKERFIGSSVSGFMMARLMDMTEFGDAAPFLRKSDLEILAAHTAAFDGSQTFSSQIFFYHGFTLFLFKTSFYAPA